MTNDQKQKEDIEMRKAFLRLLQNCPNLNSFTNYIRWEFFKLGVAWQKKRRN
jgi:hypothetical protein